MCFRILFFRHHFDCYINGQFDGRVSDPNKEQGNGSTLYAGVMLKGNLNNNVDNFTITGEPLQDNTPPSAVTDFAVGTVTQTSIQLSWTAPGDDGNIGKVTEYDIRYATFPINESNWDLAVQITEKPIPSPAGTKERFMISNLTNNTMYYFAIKARDESNNWSELSNIANRSTLPAIKAESGSAEDIQKAV